MATTITTTPPTTAEKGEEKDDLEIPPIRRKKSIQYIIQSRDKENEYLKEFINSDLCVEFQEKAEWRSWAWSKKTSQLKKEIIESYAVAKNVDVVLAALRAGKTNASKKVVFFDMASGKGLTSIVLAKKYPNATVHMLDNNGKMNLDHLSAVPTVQFKNIDLFSEEAEKLIMAEGALRGIWMAGAKNVAMANMPHRLTQCMLGTHRRRPWWEASTCKQARSFNTPTYEY